MTLLRFGGKFQAVTKLVDLLSIVTIFALLCGGCATGPQYSYIKQQDSASVEGPVVPNQGWNNGRCQVIIEKLDGLAVNFMASSPGVNLPFVHNNRQLNLEPGKHAISLDISDTEEDYGSVGHGAVGEVGTVAYGSKPTITAEVTANHIYRFSGYLSGSTIELVLWDETGGPATRTRAGSWTFDSNGNHSDSPTPSSNHR